MIPTSIIRVWFFGLFSWILLGLGIYLSHKWYQRAWSYDFNLHRSYFDPHIGNNHETLLLAVAVGLLFLVLAGGLLVRGILSFFTKTKGSADRDALPKQSREALNAIYEEHFLGFSYGFRSSYLKSVSFILGRANASRSNTQGGSPVRESCTPGSVRGAQQWAFLPR
jgi:hypothetical protein